MRFAPVSFGIIGFIGMITVATGCRSSAPAPATFSPLDQADKYQWLEDVSSERSLSWVKAQMPAPSRYWKPILVFPACRNLHSTYTSRPTIWRFLLCEKE